MSKVKQNRQGDIFFETVRSLPKGVKPYKNRILAYGETTGHSHQVTSHDVDSYESYVDEKGNIYIQAKDKAIAISHDEHSPVMLEPGEIWCVSRQREYDPIAEMNRQVAD